MSHVQVDPTIIEPSMSIMPNISGLDFITVLVLCFCVAQIVKSLRS